MLLSVPFDYKLSGRPIQCHTKKFTSKASLVTLGDYSGGALVCVLLGVYQNMDNLNYSYTTTQLIN